MNRFFALGFVIFGLINVENGLANKQQIATNKQAITVNSSADRLQPDEEMTLREAIALNNGTLSLAELSPQERTLVQTLPALSLFNRPRIVFNLPGDRTQIELQSPLPEIARSVAIDGTTQPGYVRNTPIPQPIVRITPASGVEIMRGLTITGDRITIRGLHLYGFNATSTATERTPIADIFISLPFPRRDTQLPRSNDWEFPLDNGDRAPKDITIEDNWLGSAIGSPLSNAIDTPLSKGGRGDRQSAFGIYVFNSNGTSIIRNRIEGMQGSGIITGIRANNLLIENNIIANNGFAGMPDGIRLEGEIHNSAIAGNQIQNNAGSGIYAFKPEGKIAIEDNLISDNGKRFRRAAIFLMGSDRLVRNNQIRNHPGAGIVVAAVPHSERVFLTDNQFTNVKGLSIDLIAQQRSGVQDYHNGDGINPILTEHYRRRQAANYGINAPRFDSREFFRFPSGAVNVSGKAESGTRVDLYRVLEEPNEVNLAGPLNVPLVSVSTNEEGKFAISLTNLRPGERISAIATHPDYGTSEPALNATIFNDQ
ncbi:MULTISPECIES: right-handed parallel beta-helix repeat-containing protein [Spirulina sp. CCY15215]|uniref:right-handed parallel beta-helix repeat-containing protein n=1 Tax=Spirulina sp. CCY15215 TaxID=2767591 RepID=UPI00194F1020|nr:right-handed parallel beta-helix repeat-containing protein [Spirulina major]